MSAVADPSPVKSSREIRPRRTERFVRRIIIVGLAVTALLNAGELFRRVNFWTTGSVQVDGLTFYLNPADECLTYHILEHGTWESEETRLVMDRLAPGDRVVDVGANIGWYTVLASRAIGPEGEVIAFEPDPTNFALLKKNVEANGCQNVRLEQKALSNEPGSITLYLHDRNKGMHSMLQTDEAEQAVEVEAVRLDDFLVGDSRPIDLAKIDVEGAEGLVLDGMRQTMKANPGMDLLLEFAPSRLSATGYDPESLLQELADAGFSIFEIDIADGTTKPTIVRHLIEKISGQAKPYANLLVCGSIAAGN